MALFSRTIAVVVIWGVCRVLFGRNFGGFFEGFLVMCVGGAVGPWVARKFRNTPPPLADESARPQAADSNRRARAFCDRGGPGARGRGSQGLAQGSSAPVRPHRPRGLGRVRERSNLVHEARAATDPAEFSLEHNQLALGVHLPPRPAERPAARLVPSSRLTCYSPALPLRWSASSSTIGKGVPSVPGPGSWSATTTGSARS